MMKVKQKMGCIEKNVLCTSRYFERKRLKSLFLMSSWDVYEKKNGLVPAKLEKMGSKWTFFYIHTDIRIGNNMQERNF